jgi:hypothetical protein
MTLLETDLPETLLPTIPAFISEAHTLVQTAVSQNNEAAYYCEHVFTIMLLHRERLLTALPEVARSELRTVAQSLVPAISPNCSFRAALVLQLVGEPEDAAVIEAHRPEDPVGAKAFDEAAQALRNRGALPKPP